MGVSSNVSLARTQQQHRHQSVHRDAANAATEIMAQYAHFIIIRQTGSSKNNKQHAIACENSNISLNGRQLTTYHTAGILSELSDQFITAHNG